MDAFSSEFTHVRIICLKRQKSIHSFVKGQVRREAGTESHGSIQTAGLHEIHATRLSRQWAGHPVIAAPGISFEMGHAGS
jgi:hypothetical protein